jgi:uncharacterized membrane protein HdeD (DUF308 family)
MINAIVLSIVIGILVLALAVPLGAFGSSVDFNNFQDFIDMAADIVDPIIATLDLLPTTFPLTLGFILFFAVQGLIRLVIKQFEKA